MGNCLAKPNGKPGAACDSNGREPMKQQTHSPTLGIPALREDILQEAMAGHWPGEVWLEKFLDRMETRR